MSWKSFILRLMIGVGVIVLILTYAEEIFPYASLLVFLLTLSMLVTWMIINLLKGEDVFFNIFDHDDDAG